MNRTSAMLTLMIPAAPRPCMSARGHERREARRKRAGERGEREERKPRPIYAAVAERVAKRRQRQERDGDRKLESGDDPDGSRGRDREVARHDRQRHVDDRPVEDRHRGRHAQRHERKQALGIGEAVRDLGGLGRDMGSQRLKRTAAPAHTMFSRLARARRRMSGSNHRVERRGGEALQRGLREAAPA